jgi:hypothetical protein
MHLHMKSVLALYSQFESEDAIVVKTVKIFTKNQVRLLICDQPINPFQLATMSTTEANSVIF